MADSRILKYEHDGFEWKELCRLCLLDDGIKLPIFEEEGIQRQVAHKIETCFPIVIYNTDPLPQKICHKCLFKLDTLYDFRKKCLESNTILIEKLKTFSYVENVFNYLQVVQKFGTSNGKQILLSNGGVDPVTLENSVTVSGGIFHPPKKKARLSEQQSLPNTFQEVFLDESSNNEFFSEQNDVLYADALSIVEDNNVPSSTLKKIQLPATPYPVAGLNEDSAPANDSFSASSTVIRSKETDLFITSNSNPGLNLVGTSSTSVSNVIPTNSSVSSTEVINQKSQESINLEKLTCKICNTVFENREVKDNHTCALPTSWWCEICNKYFYSISKFMNHKNSCTAGPYRCGRCDAKFGSMAEVAKHQIIHFNVSMSIREKSLLPCISCDRKYSCKKTLENHEKCHHARKIRGSSSHPVSEKNKTTVITKHAEKELVQNKSGESGKKNTGKRESIPQHKKSTGKTSISENLNDSGRNVEPTVFQNKKSPVKNVSQGSSAVKPIAKKLQNCAGTSGTTVKHQERESINAVQNDDTPMWLKKCNCSYCGMECSDSTSLWNHMREKHSSVIICNECGTSCHSQADLENHMKTHVLYCKICDRSFSSTRGFSCHNTMVHGDTLPAVDDLTNDVTRKDESLPAARKPVSTQKSGVSFTLTSKNKTVLPCSICNEILTDEVAYEKHMEIHRNKNVENKSVKSNSAVEKPSFICSTCGQACGNADRLQRHQKMHSVLLSCSYCNKKFITQDSLDAHIMSSHSQSSCSTCGVTIPAGSNSHVCASTSMNFQCDKTFSSPSHIRILAPKEVKEKSPSTENTLNPNLIQLNSGYKCKICGAVCLTLKGGQHHVKTHSQNSVERSSEHSCPFCDQKFKTVDQVYNHINMYHPDNVVG